MRYEPIFVVRPSRPQTCRKRREASRLNPSDSFAGLDPSRLSSGVKISRALGGNVSDRGFEQEQQWKKNRRKSVRLLTGNCSGFDRKSSGSLTRKFHKRDQLQARFLTSEKQVCGYQAFRFPPPATAVSFSCIGSFR
jgi:hypothetical protein